MLVPVGGGLADCTYFVFRNTRTHFNYLIQHIPLGQYEVFVYELSNTGFITSELPAIKESGEVKQGMRLLK